MLAIGLLFVFAFAVVMLAALWRIYTKAGQPGWGSLIPVYNAYCLCKIGGKPGWWLLLLFVPIVNIVITFLVLIGIAKNFGKSSGFAVGLFFLGFIFYPILGFGDAQYIGSAGNPAVATTP